MQFFTQKKFKTFTHFSWTFCKETSQICTFLILQHIDYSVNRWHFVLGGAVLNRSMFEISKVTKIYELKSVLCSFFYCFFNAAHLCNTWTCGKKRCNIILLDFENIQSAPPSRSILFIFWSYRLSSLCC